MGASSNRVCNLCGATIPREGGRVVCRDKAGSCDFKNLLPGGIRQGAGVVPAPTLDAIPKRMEPWQALCEAIRQVNSWVPLNGGTPEYAEEVLKRLRSSGWDVRRV